MLVLDAAGDRVDYAVPGWRKRTAVYGTSGFVVGLLVVALIGPSL